MRTAAQGGNLRFLDRHQISLPTRHGLVGLRVVQVSPSSPDGPGQLQLCYHRLLLPDVAPVVDDTMRIL